MSKVLLKNVGIIVSGDITNPILKGNAILIEDGKIKQSGAEGDLDAAGAKMVIDCDGATVTPGLFDSHCHVVLGDYTPRQKQTGFLESEVHGGVTTFISAGEVHQGPGRHQSAGYFSSEIVWQLQAGRRQGCRRRGDSGKRACSSGF